MLRNAECQMRIRLSVDPEDMRISKERLIAAGRWPEQCQHVAFAESSSRNGYVLSDGSAHVTERCCPSNHLLHCERHLIQVSDEPVHDLRLTNKLHQANAHNVARCFHPTEQNQHGMNDQLRKVDFLRFSVRKNRDEIVLGRSSSSFDERGKDLEQPRVSCRDGTSCRFAQHKFWVGVGGNRVGENKRLLPMLFREAQNPTDGSNRQPLGRLHEIPLAHAAVTHESIQDFSN